MGLIMGVNVFFTPYLLNLSNISWIVVNPPANSNDDATHMATSNQNQTFLTLQSCAKRQGHSSCGDLTKVIISFVLSDPILPDGHNMVSDFIRKS